MLSAAPVVGLPPNPGYFDPKWSKVLQAWDFFSPRSTYIEKLRALDDARHEALIAYELHKLGRLRCKNRAVLVLSDFRLANIIDRI